MSHRTILLHISLIDGIGPATLQAIIAHKPATISWLELYNFSVSEWCRLSITPYMASKLVAGLRTPELLERELARIERHGVQWTTILDDLYPSLLKNIHLPPIVLYWRGAALSDDMKKIAIIGSRRANQYGQRIIECLVPDLVAHNFVIVSGGAVGADGMAHRSALAHEGKTIVVLGSGLLRPYPREHVRLFEQIVERSGTVLSIFPLQVDPHPGNFPARNRVIAGLSVGIVVVQAAQKSGTRITAQFALEQGKDVFAVPGQIDDELNAGCNALIRDGAQLVSCSADILQEYGIEVARDYDKDRKKATRNSAKSSDMNIFSDPIKQALIATCAQPCSIDELAQRVGIGPHELQKHLFELQVEGVVAQDFTGMWRTV